MSDIIPMPKLKLSPRQALARLEDQVKDAFSRRWAYLMSEPKRRKRTIMGIRFGTPVLVLLLVLAGWLVFGPRRQPDYATANLDDVFDYTLLSDEFNRLSVEDRLKLIGQLVQRLKGMSAEDSLLLAAFASGISGAARHQLEENGSRLAIDLWDSYAIGYDQVPPENRDQYLEDKFVEFSKTMEGVGGEPRNISDADRINEARRQAQKDQQFAKDHPEKMPDGKALGAVFGFMNNNVGSHASPEQKQRGQLLMRDMVREFRGQDPSTGKPKNPGPP